MLNVILALFEAITGRAYYWGLVEVLIVRFDWAGTPASAFAHFFGAILCIVIPYLLGSINPAILISKTVYHEDIRSFGSGNAGTTNMLRTYGKKAAIATFLLDLSKAAVAVTLCMLLWGSYGGAFAGFFVVFGHMFPIYYRFRGGKGVLCAATAILVLSPPVFLVLILSFILLVWLTRYVSLGSITAAFLLPLSLQGYMQAFIFTGDEQGFYDAGIMLFGVIFAAIIILCHRKNIGRLWRHEENKLSFGKKDKGGTTGGK